MVIKICRSWSTESSSIEIEIVVNFTACEIYRINLLLRPLRVKLTLVRSVILLNTLMGREEGITVHNSFYERFYKYNPSPSESRTPNQNREFL